MKMYQKSDFNDDMKYGTVKDMMTRDDLRSKTHAEEHLSLSVDGDALLLSNHHSPSRKKFTY